MVSVKLKLSQPLFIYTGRLWCKLYSTICAKSGKKRGDNSRNTERCWWGLTGGKCIITHHHMLIVSLSSLTTVKDAVIVSLSVSLLSEQTSCLSAAPPMLKQDQKQWQGLPHPRWIHFFNLPCSGVMNIVIIILAVKIYVKMRSLLLNMLMNLCKCFTHKTYCLKKPCLLLP